MKLNHLTRFATVKRWLAAVLLCLWAIAFSPTYSAMATPYATLIAADLGDQVQEKTSEDAGRAKNFIRDTADSVKETARKNAKRVDEATDDGSFVERKAKRDAARIEKRAEEDTARTQKAVDNTKNAIERTVDSIKDAFSG
jgi:endonuclease III